MLMKGSKSQILFTAREVKNHFIDLKRTCVVKPLTKEYASKNEIVETLKIV
jgi:hypothetical protein